MQNGDFWEICFIMGPCYYEWPTLSVNSCSPPCFCTSFQMVLLVVQSEQKPFLSLQPSFPWGAFWHTSIILECLILWQAQSLYLLSYFGNLQNYLKIEWNLKNNTFKTNYRKKTRTGTNNRLEKIQAKLFKLWKPWCGSLLKKLKDI